MGTTGWFYKKKKTGFTILVGTFSSLNLLLQFTFLNIFFHVVVHVFSKHFFFSKPLNSVNALLINLIYCTYFINNVFTEFGILKTLS